MKRRIAERFSIPDPEILYQKWRLTDDQKVSEIGFRDGDVIYVNTSRRFMPLPLRIVMEDSEA